MVNVDDFEWVEIHQESYPDTENYRITERAQVPGGWLILIRTEWYNDVHKKFSATENVIFVSDPNYTWGI